MLPSLYSPLSEQSELLSVCHLLPSLPHCMAVMHKNLNITKYTMSRDSPLGPEKRSVRSWGTSQLTLILQSLNLSMSLTKHIGGQQTLHCSVSTLISYLTARAMPKHWSIISKLRFRIWPIFSDTPLAQPDVASFYGILSVAMTQAWSLSLVQRTMLGGSPYRGFLAHTGSLHLTTW